MFENISVVDLRKLENINLIDIRSFEKYNDGHIMNAVSIPYLELINKKEKHLNKMNKYYIYCQKGVQSRKACGILTSYGYSVVNVSGGYEAWVINE